jgi:outer membrane protein TolC
VRIQDARLQQALENFRDDVLHAARELDDAAVSIVKTREQQIPQRESTKAANRSLELANVRYREGYADFQRVIDAQRSVVNQTEREIINQSSHVSAVISFYKALGGGWEVSSVSDMLPAEMLDLMSERTDWGGLIEQPLPTDVHTEDPL